MGDFSERLFLRLALAGALAAALALGACGRKGALDPPPSAVSATGKQEPANTALIRSPFEKPAETPQGAKTPNKPFFLDPLLN